MVLVDPDGPIGIFDSGLGGLSVAREVRRLLPREPLLYLGDNLHIPYGPRPVEQIRTFSVAITRYLIDVGRCRCIVVACNTATSAAVPLLRETFPMLPIVGMEPGIKPAAAMTRSGKVAVLATMGTLAGSRLACLVERFAGGIEVLTRPCPGWVECVERGEIDRPETVEMVKEVVLPLLAEGADTLILGCTHYPFLLPVLQGILPPHVRIVDTGPAVARRVAAVLPVSKDVTASPVPTWRLLTTGDRTNVRNAARYCLGEGFDAIDGVSTLRWAEDGKRLMAGQSTN
ncbi:MAG: glutamate racemase [Capsulimonadales bacterium]|nr:glutamate racemase [Capsulimonadales bacterium]